MASLSDEKEAIASQLPEGSSVKDVQDSNSDQADMPYPMFKAETSTDQAFLEIPSQTAFRTSMESSGDLSVKSGSVDGQAGQMPNAQYFASSRFASQPKTWQGRISSLWQENKGIVLMILAQFFGSAMAAVARLMETEHGDEPPMSPFQILFARQSVTAVLSLLYLWWAKVPDAPFGRREVRSLLLARGFGGFFGVFGLYFSLLYLPLADAIVITFLAPIVSAWCLSWILKTPFTRTQAIAGFISFAGVLLIAQPVSLISSFTSQSSPIFLNTTETGISNTTAHTSNLTIVESPSHRSDDSAPAQRALAVIFSLVGVVGAASAYVTISWIGKRAHPLISVNYFATWCTFISAVAFVFPGVSFRLPASMLEWILLLSLGVSGFVMQFFLTSALAHKKSSRVLNLVYVSMLFALGFDKIIWDVTPGVVSIIGGTLILGSVIWVAVEKDDGKRDAGQDTDAEEGGIPETIARQRVTHEEEEWEGLVQGMDCN